MFSDVVNSATFSFINDRTRVWGSTAGSITIPGVDYKGSPFDHYGLGVGSASVNEFILNGLFYITGSSMCYSNDRSNISTIPRGINYQISEHNTTTSVNLPANPKVGDYVWYENHNTATGRIVITVNGNGNSIRSFTNSIVASVTTGGLFHYDGTYWNNIYQ